MYGQYTPDDTMIRNLCLGYSYRNPPMWNSSVFPQGVVIGWEWYVIHGGMQDWAYYWRNEINITGEISNTTWPPSSQLPGFWEDNREAMLWFMSQVRIGVEGYVTDAANGDPIKATIGVAEIGKDLWGEPLAGYYHRLLEPGTYTLEFSAFGYNPQTVAGVVIAEGDPTQLDVQLTATERYEVSGEVTEEGTGLPLAAQVTAVRHDNGEPYASADTDPATGAYALEVPGWEYDFVAAAEQHVTVTETRTVDGNLTLDFSLLPARGDVLLVRDSNGSPRMADDLAALGYLVTDETTATTDPDTWPDHDLLIWTAGAAHNPVSSSGLRTALEGYVAGQPRVSELRGQCPAHQRLGCRQRGSAAAAAGAERAPAGHGAERAAGDDRADL
jgi:hypothetical protein